MLKISNLSISYSDLYILKNTEFEAGVGITCITGKSGSGKSSLLNVIAKQIKFQADSYSYNNVDLLTESDVFIREQIAYLTQNSNFLSDLSCFDNIRFFSLFNNVELSDEDIYKYLSIVGLGYIDSKTFPDNLSGGEKQRLAIAQAIAKGSKIILCDEITASLDQTAKIQILSLLKKLTHDYSKIIVMTSHEDVAVDFADRLYCIENSKLNLLMDNKIDVSQKIDKAVHKVNLSKMLNRYILSKLDRQKGISLLYFLITAIVVSICAFLTFFTFTSLSEQRTILNRLCQNQIYIINQTEAPIGNNSYSYYSTNLVFEKNVSNQIKNVKGISSLYPYYWFPLVNPQELYQNHQITLMYENKEDKVVNLTSSPFDFAISPYYEEQEFNKKMEIVNSNDLVNGAYVNHVFLAMTGLTKDDLVGATIKLTAYIPVSYEEITFTKHISDTGESFEQIAHNQIGKFIEFEIPIIGYVDFWYNEEWAQGFIYCPIDYLEGLRNQNSSIFNDTTENKKWEPNAYIGFIDNQDQMEKVVIDLKGIDENIATGNKYMDNKAMYEQKRYVEITTSISTIIVLTAGIILSYVYGIYYYQKNINDVHYLKRNKFSLREFKQLIIFDALYQMLINFLFALPIVVVISYFGQIYLNMFRFGFLSRESLFILLLLIVFIIIQSLVSRLYYYKSVLSR